MATISLAISDMIDSSPGGRVKLTIVRLQSGVVGAA